ncbi:endonuclease MutS2 [bacterium]|nr:endonuclease MutS2 [bacterium]
MQERFSLRLLEYDAARALLARFLASPLGAARLAEMAPSRDPERIKAGLAEIRECRRALDEHGAPPLDGLCDLSAILRHARIPRAMLAPEDLLKVRATLAVCRRVNAYLAGIRSPGTHFADYLLAIVPFPDLEKHLERCLDDDGALKDNASRELASIRKAIRRLQDEINQRLVRLSRGALKEYLQEDYITQRNGRYVLAVASKWKNQVKGIVHDRSETGATTYIEPIGIVDLGNQLQDQQAEEAQETRRILVHLTAQVARVVDPLSWAVEALADLDFALAKARFAVAFHCRPPEMSEDGRLRLVQGRHPLLMDILGWDKVVPTSLELDRERRAVVITGPNTGGKTVVLKTVGLLCLLFQSGMEIPCDDGTLLPVFDAIRADIGDEQSLVQSLSTFSSHMGNIRRILEESDERTLVLLDELGAGTDPIEGGALGTAIVEHLVSRGACTLVTTHLPDLKLLAHAHAHVVNAAMLFDEETLAPTFQLQMGRAGRSNALSIAQRLGLPEEVIGAARGKLRGQGNEAARLLMQLEEDVSCAERERRDAELARMSAERLQRETLAELRRAQKERAEAGQRARAAAQAMLAELRDETRQLKQRLKRAHATLDEAARVQLESQVAETSHVIEAAAQHPQLAPLEEEETPVRVVPPEEIALGAHVRVEGFSGVAQVLAVDPKKQEVAVSICDMHLRVPFQQSLGLVEPPQEHAPPVEYEPVEMESPSLDVIGLTVEEMRPKVERFLDHAYLARLPQAWIIHGHGTGTLKRAVRDLLAGHPLVQRFHNGSEVEGGAGVTVVTFKER